MSIKNKTIIGKEYGPKLRLYVLINAKEKCFLGSIALVLYTTYSIKCGVNSSTSGV